MSQIKEIQYNKMTETSVSKLIIKLGLPTTISMLVTNLYNMADTWFVSTINLSATGAVGVVFGLMAIIQAFGFTFGHGSGSNLSRLLGAKKSERAKNFSATGFYLSLLAGGIIMLLGLIFLNPLCRLLGSSDTILPYARTYAVYILLSAPAMASGCVMNNLLRYEGQATLAMVGLISGSILNIGGDALFVSVLKMGISGAGLSTLLSQYISFGILLRFFFVGKTQSSFSPKYFSRKGEDIFNICATGFPSMMRQGLASISTMVLNGQALVYGDATIAAMSVVSRIFNFLFSVALGIGQGFQPVSSFNYGAGKFKRVRKAFLFTFSLGTAMMMLFAIGGLLFDDQLVRMFLDDKAAVDIAKYTLRLQCFTLILVPLSICGNMLFQSIGLAGRATLLASLRNGVIFIPVVLYMTKLWGLNGIEWSQSVADIIATVITLPFVISFLRKLNKDN